MKTPRTKQKLLTAALAARICGVTSASIRNWTRDGSLRPEMVTESGMRLYDRVAVEQFAAKRGAAKVAR